MTHVIDNVAIATVDSWVPPVAGGLLRRRLHEAFDRADAGDLLVVAGPAGSGKTTALAMWAAEAAVAAQVAWVGLSPLDGDPAVFWGTLTTALDRATGVTGQPETVGALARSLAQVEQPLVIVLDNGEYLRRSAGTVSALLSHDLPQVRVVFATREAPAAHLSRLRLIGRLTEVGPDDLAFSPREAAQYWSMRQRVLTPAEATALVERTGGLAAGVCAPDVHTAGFTDVLADFLRAELLGRLPAEQQDFVLRCSLLDDLDARSAEAITGRRDAARLLDHLRREHHLLVRPAEDPERLQLRRPYAAFLRDEAGLLIAEHVTDVHARAAQHYAEHDRPEAALRHAAASRQADLAAEVGVRVAAPLVLGAARDVFLDLPTWIPARDAVRHPETATVLALAAAARDDAHTAGAYARLARDRFAEVTTERRLPMQAALCLGDLLLARQREDVEAIGLTMTALLELLDATVPGLVPAADGMRAIAAECLGHAALWTGDLTLARSSLEAAAVHSGRHELTLSSGAALGGLALVHALRGDVGQAAQLAYARDPAASDVPAAYRRPARLARGLVLWLRGAAADALTVVGTESGDADDQPSAYATGLVRARILLTLGNVPAARDALAVAGPATGPSLLDDWRAVTTAELHLAEGRPAKAVTAARYAMRDGRTPLDSHACIVAARAHLAGGELNAASRILEAVHRTSATAGPWAQVNAWLAESLIADRLGHEGAVRIAIGTALVIADVDGLVAPFGEVGGEARALLDRNRDLVADYPLLSVRLDAVRPAVTASGGDRLLEDLTDRELAVLRYLPSLLTVRDVAAELSVSQNTVKTHVRSIYRKLSVGTRRDAVGRARRLGLL
ncbi:LuxR C-terminal-related transcriptional regulator [Hamadaea sp. NPDC050747]|uniref:LuxR C-terminal-related transcriptional regulator n=1 Tax=Hamadaea sp. NPDC050747 TaxID=3155789 RepID=UPI0033FCF8D9